MLVYGVAHGRIYDDDVMSANYTVATSHKWSKLTQSCQRKFKKLNLTCSVGSTIELDDIYLTSHLFLKLELSMHKCHANRAAFHLGKIWRVQVKIVIQ